MAHSGSVSDELRKAVKAELAKQGRSQTEVAQAIGITRQHLSRMLSNRATKGGISRAWAKLLAEMGLEVVVQPRRGSQK